jgi:arylsulfatase A-like enzyme
LPCQILKRAGLKIRAEHLLLYVCIFILAGAAVWKIKKLFWPYVQTSPHTKLIVFAVLAILSIVPIWFLREKAERWISAIQERITPLVWIFGVFVILSVPLVCYHAWWKETGIAASETAGRSFQGDKDRPNIILITFDALAARDMSLYGYFRETTPFISRWAKDASVFTKVEAASNFTTSATASLMTGKRVWTHQVYHLEGSKPLKSDIESLPLVLKENGYFNMAFVVNPHTSVKVLGMSDSFDIAPIAAEFSTPESLFGWKFGILDVYLYRLFGDRIRLHNWVLRNDFILSRVINKVSRNIYTTTVPAEKAFNSFLKAADQNPQKPFFAWIHLFPPHDPYLPPPPYSGVFNPSPDLRTYRIQEDIINKTYGYLFQYQKYPDEMNETIGTLRDHYDEFVRYCDDQFRVFINQLEQRGLTDNTIIILTSDHGESFEHGYFTHGGPFLYEQVTHIPLVISEPGRSEGLLIDSLAEQIDIPATILDFAEIKPPLWMEGRSLRPFLGGVELPPKQAFSMFLESNPSRGHKITKGSIAVWEGDYKLIHYLEKDESLLFNLKVDIDELDNLFEKEKGEGRRLLKLINDNLMVVNEKISREWQGY